MEIHFLETNENKNSLKSYFSNNANLLQNSSNLFLVPYNLVYFKNVSVHPQSGEYSLGSDLGEKFNIFWYVNYQIESYGLEISCFGALVTITPTQETLGSYGQSKLIVFLFIFR